MTHTFTCLVHRLDFEHMEDHNEKMFFVRSDSEELEEAHHKLKERLQQMNDQMEDETFLSCHSLYVGKRKVNAIELNKLNAFSIHHKSINLM